MSRRTAAIAIVLIILISTGVAATYYFRSSSTPAQYEGWVEGDFVFVSPDEIGRIITLSVREGSVVKIGAPLFTLDDDLQRAAVAENVAYAANAKQAYIRANRLFKDAVGSRKTLEDAEALLRSAEAKLNSARTRLERRRMFSPVAGTIQEIYFRVGELVEPGRPVVSILPPGNVKVRFFVPQATLPSIGIGDQLLIDCDGCRKGLFARASFISAQAEFTPPVIYSLDERARLVFRIEAIPEQPEHFRIGQPVSVVLQSSQTPVTIHGQN